MGWNGSDGKNVTSRASSTRAARHGSRTWLGVAIAAAAILALLVCFLMGGRDSDVRRVSAKTKASNIPSASPRTNRVKKVSTPKAKPKTVGEALDNLGEFERPEVEPAANVIDVDTIRPNTNHVFSTGTEQLMSWLFTCELGNPPIPIPPLPKDERQQLAAILVSKNAIEESDSETARFCKETVDAVKREMIKYIKDGGDPDDFLDYYFHELQSAWEYRETARNQGSELSEEDPGMGREFLQKVNEKLKEQGIKELTADDFGLDAAGAEESLGQETVAE